MWRVKKIGIGLLVLISACSLSGCSALSVDKYVAPDARSGGHIVMQTAAAQNTDPFAAGRAAAQVLKDKMGQTSPHAVVIAECFEDRAAKNRALKGVCSVFPRQIVFGFSTYGSFSQAGCLDVDSVGLLGIGGDGISVSAALRKNLGIAGLTMEANEDELQSRLRTGGADLAGGIARRKDDRLLVVMADAHSPKNQFLVEGAQRVVGKKFPITGGSPPRRPRCRDLRRRPRQRRHPRGGLCRRSSHGERALWCSGRSTRTAAVPHRCRRGLGP